MGFLDNLESSLKSLEGNQERENSADQQQRRQDERARALAAAPHAEALKKSSFVNDLLLHAVKIGHGMRIKVNMAWIGSTLRLDARESRLELQPTPDGVVAEMSDSGEVRSSERLDLANADAEAFAKKWLSALEPGAATPLS
jgi:hypothetical protein